jgi:hypothetical protein
MIYLAHSRDGLGLVVGHEAAPPRRARNIVRLV